ncbi:hypothetical protein HNQ07_001920 [Deinococcus metalli]|uniref:Cyclase dehydrase n=1 Tax=Deinococcus metalli TaxID=1141878 RepID=A0A7W8KG98_9DEIO|nr:hypothetical protein [Deinococcus metalli]MBB5376456.1 hypothetical protein [Deinococcus metalli]GHF43898.1 hypothetical protein GCM10017781_20450 [Deinococcus metalli]
MNAQQVARGLGWFSLGLGTVELLAPGHVGRFVGARAAQTHGGLVRAYGVREVIAGLGLLTQPAAAAPWVWARVAGDVLDLATVGRARPDEPHAHQRLTRSLLMLSGVTLLDVLVARALSQAASPSPARRIAAHAA